MREQSIHDMYDQAVRQHQTGKLTEAEAAYRQILRFRPNHSDTLHLLGVLVGQNGRKDEALELIRRAIGLDPTQATYLFNLGTVLTKAAQFEEAAAEYRKAVELRHNFPEAWHSLGDALYALGKFEESVAAYREALQLNPRHIEAHNNLGMSLMSLSRTHEAIEQFREALNLRPEYSRASNNLGMALQILGQWEEAIVHFEQAVRHQKDSANAVQNLGKALYHENRIAEALPVFEKLVTMRGNEAEAHFNLGCALRLSYQHERAAESFIRAIELQPDSLSARNNLAAALNHLARLDESIVQYDRILELDPHFIAADSNRLFTLMFNPRYDSAAILAEARKFDQRHAQPLVTQIRPHQNDPNPTRRLRIGYLSPDFKNHCQQFFTIPVLSNHDHAAFEIYCYADVDKPDDVTNVLRGFTDVWRNISDMSEGQVAELIREDKIDILMDLTMHMADTRRLIYARKPAPIQVAWLAYPGTTGMATIDYRLTDPYLDPPGEHDADYSERSIRLPHTFWIYDARTDKPPINPLPALTNGYLTFGCMNNFAKVSEPALRLWGKVLRQIPNSHLILMAPPGKHRQRIPEILGVDPERVEFISFQTRPKYLSTYHRIDLGLDSIPYNGHTTSLDSLWMGVPVITLVGNTVVGRAGWSQLNNLNLTEFAAFNEDDFVRIAVDLSKDLPHLAEVRSGLRKRMEASPLMNAPLFVHGLEEIYRQIWRDWCTTAGRSVPPVILEQAKRHHHAGRLPEAENLYRQILAQEPNHPDALHLLGVIEFQTGRRDVAQERIRRAIQLEPRRAEYHCNLGLTLADTDPEQAIAEFRTAIEIQPNFLEALCNLGTLLGDRRHWDESLSVFEKALDLGADVVDELSGLALAMRSLARLDDALRIYDRILAARPDSSAVHGDRCYLLQLMPEYDAPMILREHLEWNRRHAQPLAGEIRVHDNYRNPDRPLRVGYVSPDFKNHCQQFFTVPLLSRHDHHQFEIYCYARVPEPDDVTALIRRFADVWHDISKQSDAEVAQKIRYDKIDILVDLTMHMPGGRPLLFARKPAPVQIAWLAYPGTTGMPAVDYRLTDPYLDPPGETDAFYAERSIRLPHTFWCYDPRARWLEINPLPARSAGHITFGCLNSFCKVNDRALALWSQVLKRLPTSRLILYLPDVEHRAKIPPRLDVDPARVDFVPLQSRDDYLKTYNRIDLGLDTIPYNGHTTSLDSFWMGVPVVTLVGKTVVGRAGWSQLNNLDLKELAAFNEADFVRIAVELAGDLPRLAELRRGLRQRMQKSPLMDAALFTRGLEAVYRQLWRNWCESNAAT